MNAFFYVDMEPLGVQHSPLTDGNGRRKAISLSGAIIRDTHNEDRNPRASDSTYSKFYFFKNFTTAHSLTPLDDDILGIFLTGGQKRTGT
jgi:hypothetical protein